MGRRVLTRHGPRRRPGDPRGPQSDVLVHCYARRRSCRHRRARCVPSRAGWCPRRRHARRHGRRLPTVDARTEGLGSAFMATTNDLKNGMALNLPEGLFQIVEFQHVKPGKGGAFVRTTLKNVRTGAVIDRTFRAAEKVEQAVIDRREMQFLYRDGSDFVFMDKESYDQLTVTPASLGDAANYIVDGSTAQLALYENEIVGVELPAAVELTVSETEPGIQGDRVSGARKPATLETGLVVQVPLFINIGDRLKVDTRSGDYITRV